MSSGAGRWLRWRCADGSWIFSGRRRSGSSVKRLLREVSTGVIVVIPPIPAVWPGSFVLEETVAWVGHYVIERVKAAIGR